MDTLLYNVLLGVRTELLVLQKRGMPRKGKILTRPVVIGCLQQAGWLGGNAPTTKIKSPSLPRSKVARITGYESITIAKSLVKV